MSVSTKTLRDMKAATTVTNIKEHQAKVAVLSTDRIASDKPATGSSSGCLSSHGLSFSNM